MAVRIQTAYINGVGQLYIRKEPDGQDRLLVPDNFSTAHNTPEKIARHEMIAYGQPETGAEILAEFIGLQQILPDLFRMLC